ncbi:MAG: hypothetical protein ACOYL5_02860 [Phototrophicaceae bacterium]|jgi:hypothetical protein
MTDDPQAGARESLPPDHIGVLLMAALLAVGGGLGLYTLVTQTIPRVAQQWVFFFLLQLTLTGIAIPVIRFLNVRFTPINRPLPPGGVIVRQATWVGLFVATCAWLQIPRVLSGSVAFFLALIFLVIEFFIRLRERAAEIQ